MAHVNLYLPDELARKVRAEAKRRGKSLSAYIAALLEHPSRQDRLDEEFFTKVVGGWVGEFPEIADRPPEDRESL